MRIGVSMTTFSVNASRRFSAVKLTRPEDRAGAFGAQSMLFLCKSTRFFLQRDGADFPKATYVGEPVCRACHTGEAAAWKYSDHARAMAHGTEATVLGNVNDARFTYRDVTTTASFRSRRRA